MNRPRKRLGDLTPAERADLGVKNLKRSRRCERWVCREYLALPVGPTVEQIVSAVHGGIHDAMKQKDAQKRREKMTASIKAGSILLSGMGL